MVGPLPQGICDAIGQFVTTVGEVFGGLAEEHRGRRGTHQPRPVQLVEGFQQAQPVVGRLRFEHIGVAGVDSRDAGGHQRIEAGPGIDVALGDDGDVVGRQCVTTEGGPGGQQRGDVGGQVGGDVPAQRIHPDGAGSPLPERLSADHPQPERLVVRRAGQPVALMTGLHLEDLDVGIPELGPAEHRLQPVHQCRVTTPIDAERAALPGGLGGVQIGEDVATAERVDRLLGVADEDQRRLPAERPFDHLPLHRVGVLELVDHYHRPPLVHAGRGRGVVGLQRIGQPAEQVVVA